MKRIAPFALLAAAFFSTLASGLYSAGAAAVGWPDTIQLLTQVRTQAQVCAGLLKGSNDKTAIGKGALAYGLAQGQMDGLIGGLTTALVMGGNPADLKGLQAAVDKGAAGLKEVCDSAIKLTATAGTKGVAEEIAKGAIEPLADLVKSAVGALWTRHVEKDKLELETIKTQLEAAKWPAFGEIAAQ